MRINLRAKHLKTNLTGLVLYLDFVNNQVVVVPNVEYEDGGQETWKLNEVEITQIEGVTIQMKARRRKYNGR